MTEVYITTNMPANIAWLLRCSQSRRAGRQGRAWY
jgi:hypothetical protein